jgi:trk system potassium uptake protein TrkA
VRKADIVGVSSLRRGVAEAIEAVAHGDESTSRVVGRSIDEIKLPPGTIIGAVVRGNDVMIANNNLRIEQGDHVIMFLTDKSLFPTSKGYSSQVLSSCNSGRSTGAFLLSLIFKG